MTARLVLDGLSKRFEGRKETTDTPALKKLDLEVEDGELLVLVGPSGCGKSTALRLIAGLEQPTEGRVLLDGKDLVEVPPHARDVAMVFQGYALYPHLTVAQNISFPLEMRKVSRAERERRVREVAATVGLEGKLDRLPSELSGGERQRVAMGRAIVRRPKIFLFDEPLSNLDAKLRSELRSELVQLVRRLGVTAIYVTHDQGEAMTMGDRIAVLRAGELMQLAAPRTIYERPENGFVAGFVGTPSMNLVQVAASRASGGLALGVSHAATVGFRPESVTFVVDAVPTGAGVRITGKVVLVEPQGAETYVHIDTDAGLVRARLEGFGGPALGTRVVACVAAEALHWFDEGGRRVEPPG